MRAFPRRAMIFRLENVPARHDVLYDAVLFFLTVELVFNTPKQHRAKQDGNDARRLGVGHAEKRTRVDANKFDKEAGDAGEESGNCRRFSPLALGPRRDFVPMCQRKSCNRQPDEKLVKGSGMYAFGRGDKTGAESLCPTEARSQYRSHHRQTTGSPMPPDGVVETAAAGKQMSRNSRTGIFDQRARITSAIKPPRKPPNQAKP